MSKMTLRLSISSVLAASVLGMLPLLSVGCASSEPTRQTSNQRPTATERPAAQAQPPREPASEAASDLASIAERDVQAFLARQQRQDETARDRDRDRRADSQRQPEKAPPRREDREILWNLPGEQAAASIPSPDPIALDGPQIGKSELFLIPDEEEKSVDAPSATDFEQVPEDELADLDRDRIRELIVDLSKELYRDATYSDMPLRELMLIAATTIVTPDRALKPEAIPALTPRERELLSEFQTFFTHIGKELDGSRTADEVLVHAVNELRAALSTAPQLYLETVALCTRVGGFGDYDQFDRYSFLAHSEQQAVLYLELAGFTSELNQQSQWVTELSLQLMIYSDRDGIPVWREDWQSAVDVSRNKRQDFFMVQVMTLPQALSVGRYHLKVRVRDEKSGAETEASIPFEMVADPKLATGALR